MRELRWLRQAAEQDALGGLARPLQGLGVLALRLDEDVGGLQQGRTGEVRPLGVVDPPAFGGAGGIDVDLRVEDGPDQGLLIGLLAARLVLDGPRRQAEFVGPMQQQGLDRQRLASGGAGLGGRQAGVVLNLLGDEELGDLDPFDDDGGGRGCGGHGGYSAALRGVGRTAGVVGRIAAG